MNERWSFALGIAAYPARGRTGWGLATEDSDLITGKINGTSEDRALLAAFEKATSFFDVANTVSLYCNSETFHRAVRPMAAAWPRLELRPPDVSGRLVRDAWRAARDTVAGGSEAAKSPRVRLVDVADPRTDHRLGPRRIIAATDGSVGTGVGPTNRAGAYGWITDTGRHGSGQVKGIGKSVVLAELRAVQSLLSQHRQDDRFEILIDSRWAISGLEQMRSGAPLDQLRNMPRGVTRWPWLEDLRARVEGSSHVFTWVPAHSGNVFNETADRLAVQTRRYHQGMFDQAVFQTVIARIVNDFHEATAGMSASGATTQRGLG